MREIKRKRPAPSVRKAIEVRDRLPERFQGIWWDMVRTGMRVKEFWGPWTVEGDAVTIAGTVARSSAGGER